MRNLLACVCFALVALGTSLRADPAATPASGELDPIVGKWRYWNGEGYRLVTLGADGSASSSSGVKGIWKYLPGQEVERKYQIIFKEGFYTDNVTLSTSGKHLNGRNAKKQNIRAERIEE